MENLKLSGLKNVLKKFDEHQWKGSFTNGNWRIANGGYDLWFELYYCNQPVVRCEGGVLSSSFDLPLIEKAKLYHKILETFVHLSLARDAYFSTDVIEEAIEFGWNEEEAKRGWSYFEDADLPGILVIERLDDMDVFEGDLEAGQFAKACGEKLFSLQGCEYPLNAYFFKDTPENREAVLQYAKENGLKVNLEEKKKPSLDSMLSQTKEDLAQGNTELKVAQQGKEMDL